MPFHFFAAGTITLGYKQYELSNHLGNVLTTIADNVIKTTSSGTGLLARIVSTQDYYPFGMGMVERAYQEPTVNNERSYRYGFNNQEIDDDLENGAVVFKYRIESTKLCRFWSVDPLAAKYPWNSPYAFAENRVIDGIDLEGAEWVKVADNHYVVKIKIVNSSTVIGNVTASMSSTEKAAQKQHLQVLARAYMQEASRILSVNGLKVDVIAESYDDTQNNYPTISSKNEVNSDKDFYLELVDDIEIIRDNGNRLFNKVEDGRVLSETPGYTDKKGDTQTNRIRLRTKGISGKDYLNLGEMGRYLAHELGHSAKLGHEDEDKEATDPMNLMNSKTKGNILLPTQTEKLKNHVNSQQPKPKISVPKNNDKTKKTLPPKKR
jgi:RHS repeat-associated protein